MLPTVEIGSDRYDDDDTTQSTTTTTSSRERTLKVVIISILAFFLIFVIIDSLTDQQLKSSMLVFLEWVGENPTKGVFAVIFVYALATVLFVPGSILTIGTGFAFGMTFGVSKGVALASITVFIGASIGSIASFLLGRYLFRSCVEGLTRKYPIFEAIDKALAGNGLKIMILLRLSPLIPYNALDYMSGLTAIPLWSYSLAMVGVIPGVILFTFLGATASTFTADENIDNENVRIFSLTFGLLTALLGVFVASYYAKVELAKIMLRKHAEEERSMIARYRTSIHDLV